MMTRNHERAITHQERSAFWYRHAAFWASMIEASPYDDPQAERDGYLEAVAHAAFHSSQARMYMGI